MLQIHWQVVNLHQPQGNHKSPVFTSLHLPNDATLTTMSQMWVLDESPRLWQIRVDSEIEEIFFSYCANATDTTRGVAKQRWLVQVQADVPECIIGQSIFSFPFPPLFFCPFTCLVFLVGAQHRTSRSLQWQNHLLTCQLRLSTLLACWAEKSGRGGPSEVSVCFDQWSRHAHSSTGCFAPHCTCKRRRWWEQACQVLILSKSHASGLVWIHFLLCRYSRRKYNLFITTRHVEPLMHRFAPLKCLQ